MAKILFSNNATTKLAIAIKNTDTSLSVTSGTGQLFPTIASGSGDYFYITLVDSSGNHEIVKVTGKSTDTFTIVRGQDGTTARAFAVNSRVEQRVTAGALNDVVANIVNSINNIPNTIYPVGSIYMSLTSTDPSVLFGGSWEKLDDGRVLLGANDTYTAGSTGGSFTRKLSTDNIPAHTHTATVSTTGAHTHTRGTMNITGTFAADDMTNDSSVPITSGAFSSTKTYTLRDGQNGKAGGYQFNFDASKSWTGATSSAGNHTHTVTLANTGKSTAFNITQPYLAVYMWKRIA